MKNNKNIFGDRIDWENHVYEIIDSKDNIFYGKDQSSEKISRIKKYKPHGKVLDCGCHIGRFIDVFRENGYDYTGVDQSEYALETAKKYKPDGKFVHSLLWDMTYDNEFDIVHTNAVLQHNLLKEQEKILIKMNQSLKNGGILVITESTVNEETTTQRTYKGWIKIVEKYSFKFMESWHKNELGIEDNYLFIKVKNFRKDSIKIDDVNNRNISREDLVKTLNHKKIINCREDKECLEINKVKYLKVNNTKKSSTLTSKSNKNEINITKFWNSKDKTIPIIECIMMWRKLKIDELCYFICEYQMSNDKIEKILKIFEMCGFVNINNCDKIVDMNNPLFEKHRLTFKKLSICKINNWEYLRYIHQLIDN